ncbi:hypothetical protein NXG27_07895 [Megasphaera paucivorans]|uniref:Uncharacterized protein n=1 Tax=Megasphaera paucivorans TaxID=349095 RepID=A0A1G9XUX0_9FIRM|nr:hypothetical protein [Megasphaera paucivorans]SDN00033.1 hypothetical protein SAMN05660299_01920 [Megasphaera paucivorans]
MDTIYKEISSSSVKLEIKDTKTGKIFIRELPIDYYENSYCLRLKGEGLDGKPVEMIFYSKEGVDKLKDLTGSGPDKDNCK